MDNPTLEQDEAQQDELQQDALVQELDAGNATAGEPDGFVAQSLAANPIASTTDGSDAEPVEDGRVGDASAAAVAVAEASAAEENAAANLNLNVTAPEPQADPNQLQEAVSATASDSGEPPPRQESLALVGGEPFTQLPEDLYIPPDALEVFLEAFEGPLDLLLYLIKRQNLDILDIPVASITRQYMEYVELMKELHLELAADYLVMAAMLAEIKSRVLLPRPTVDEEEDDPRAELVRRLQEYERFKTAAEDLDQIPRLHRDVFQGSAKTPDLKIVKPLPEVDLKELLLAFKDVIKRVENFTNHQIQMEPLSLRERMSQVLERIQTDKFTEFTSLFTYAEGRRGLVVTFLAILELMKESLIEIVQTAPFEPIHLKTVEA